MFSTTVVTGVKEPEALPSTPVETNVLRPKPIGSTSRGWEVGGEYVLVSTSVMVKVGSKDIRYRRVLDPYRECMEWNASVMDYSIWGRYIVIHERSLQKKGSGMVSSMYALPRTSEPLSMTQTSQGGPAQTIDLV